MDAPRKTITFHGPHYAEKAGTFRLVLSMFGESPGGMPMKIVMEMEPYQVEYLAEQCQEWAKKLRAEALRLAQSIGAGE